MDFVLYNMRFVCDFFTLFHKCWAESHVGH